MVPDGLVTGSALSFRIVPEGEPAISAGRPRTLPVKSALGLRRVPELAWGESREPLDAPIDFGLE